MDSLKRLLLKHKTSTAILDIVPRWNERKAIVQQDAGNCWLYVCFNNLWLNLGYKVSETEIQEIKDRLHALGVDTETIGNSEELGGAVICERWNERNAKKITMYSLNFYRNPARMGTILKNGYALIYGRSNKPEILEDIKDNDVVDEIHNVRGNWHAVNICVREEGKAQLMEIGQRWEAHYANEFTYKNVLIFGDNIKAGSIDQDFTFFDYL